jgi:hypothetical protein
MKPICSIQPPMTAMAIGGGHSAFHSEVPQIAEFFTSDTLPAASDQAGAGKGLWPALLHFQSLYAFWVVWGFLALLIGFPGVRIAVAAGGLCVDSDCVVFWVGVHDFEDGVVA